VNIRLPNQLLYCRVGSQIWSTEYVEPQVAICNVNEIKVGKYDVRVSFNLVNWFGEQSVEVYPALSLLSITPSSGPITGGTPVLLSGIGFDFIDGVALRPFCRFGSIEITATILDGNHASCNTPQFYEDQYTVSVDFILRYPTTKQRIVFYVPDSKQVVFSFYDSILLDSITPRSGSSSGGTLALFW